MKAITVRQPWATLIAVGAKRVETRSWRTSYRGPLAIHAAQAMRGAECELCDAEPFRAALVDAGFDTPADLPRGVIVASCRLLAVVPIQGPPLMVPRAEHDLEFGDFTPGRFAWLLGRVEQLPELAPAKGALGLWEWTPALIA